MNIASLPIIKPLTQDLLPRPLLDRLSNDGEISITGQGTFYEDDGYRSVRGLMWDRVQSELDPNQIQAFIIALAHGGTSSKAYRWAKAAGRNPLHYAAVYGDVVVAYEQLFMGASPTYPDETGLTPLYYALLSAARCKVPTAILRISADNLKPLHEMISELPPSGNYPANLSHICAMLIQQHADVNESHYGTSVLCLACIAQDWNVIALLLQHGARNNVTKSTYASLSWDADASEKFEALVTEHTLASGRTRPPRICPCWSGKLLKDCHQNPDAVNIMDDSLPCVCGRQERKYANCCKKHKITVEEYWDATQNGLRRKTSNLQELVGNTRYAKLMRIARYKMQHCFDDTPLPAVITGDEHDTNFPWPTRKTKLLTERLLNEGKIDPAFAHLILIKRPPLYVFRTLLNREAVTNNAIDVKAYESGHEYPYANGGRHRAVEWPY